MADKFYVICTTPRSGSNLLCNLLETSGVMGQPSEFLNPEGSLIPGAKKYELIESDYTINLDKYLDKIIAKHSSKNGVFGLKLLYDQFENFRNFRQVKNIFKKSKFILLLRKDIVAQAVSMHIATETDMWKSFEENEEKRKMVDYKEDKISFYADRFVRQDLRWIDFFSINQLEYLQVFYEDILINPHKICSQICNFCEVETEHHFSLGSTKFKKQGNELNEKFIQMFRHNSDFNINKELMDYRFKFKEFNIV